VRCEPTRVTELLTYAIHKDVFDEAQILNHESPTASFAMSPTYLVHVCLSTRLFSTPGFPELSEARGFPGAGGFPGTGNGLLGLIPWNLLLATMNLWYAVPLLISVSLVCAATRQEEMGSILQHALRFAVWVVVFMGIVMVVLTLLGWLA